MHDTVEVSSRFVQSNLIGQPGGGTGGQLVVIARMPLPAKTYGHLDAGLCPEVMDRVDQQ
jgi:hypothetical protein